MPQGSRHNDPPTLTTCRLCSQTLKEWVAVESDSVQPAPRLRRELLRMVGLAADRLRGLGARVASVDAGFQQVLVPLRPASRLRQAPLPGPGRGFPGLLSPPTCPVVSTRSEAVALTSCLARPRGRWGR